MGRAYKVAQPGQTVGVESGDYPAQQIDVDPSKATAARVRFTALGPVQLASVALMNAKHLRFEGSFEVNMFFADGRGARGTVKDVELDGLHIHSSALQGVQDFKLLNSEMGPNAFTAAPGYQDDILYFGTAMSSNVLIEGNRFHDATHPKPTSHTDCIQFTMGTDVTIRRNTFQRCYDQSMIIKGDQGALTRFTLENNFVDRPVAPSSAFGLQIAGTTPCEDCNVLNNTFLGVPRLEAPLIGRGVVYGNLAENGGSGSCSNSLAQGWTWSSNVFEHAACGANAYAIPGGDAHFVDRANLDLHLLSSSAAIGRGDPAVLHPSDDYDGQLPTGVLRTDAGADQS
jgi:hypothetical protein